MPEGVEVDVKLLEEIRGFPEPARRKLETGYGIDSAEAFFAGAITNPAGMALAIDAEPARIVGGISPAQAGDAARAGIAVHPRVLQRLRQLVDHMGGRRRVRVAHAEVDHVLAAGSRRRLHGIVVDGTFLAGRSSGGRVEEVSAPY